VPKATRAELLQDLWLDYENDPHWAHLRVPGIRLVEGNGPVDADVMIVGEAPGARENGAGAPFIGQSGIVLDSLIELAGWKRSEVYVTNVVKYRPPGNRTPTAREVVHGREYLRREWGILRPRYTVCVGAVAHLTLRGAGFSVGAKSQRGYWEEFGEGLVTSSYHPAFGLRNPKMRPVMEADWERMREGKRYAQG
jgi:DNA polymerase